jgi:hypothetical protein
MFITQAGRLTALIRCIDRNARGRKMCHQSCGHMVSNYVNNLETIPEPRISKITKLAQLYGQSLKDKVDIMSSGRIPDTNFKYQPKGKRSLGRTLKRWKVLVSNSHLGSHQA